MMRKLWELTRRCALWAGFPAAALALIAGTPARAVDLSAAACITKMTGKIALKKGIATAQYLSTIPMGAGLPVMNQGILRGLGSINESLSDVQGATEATAEMMCDINDTLSTKASPTVFLGWVEADDVLPLPTLLSAQIDGTSTPTLLGRVADLQDEAAIRVMSLNLIDGAEAEMLKGEGDSLASIEGLVLSSITEEKKELAASRLIETKLRAAGNIKDIIALQAMTTGMAHKASLRANLIANLGIAAQKEAEFRQHARRELYSQDHLSTSKRLALPL